MDRNEARTVLAQELLHLRSKRFEDLQRLIGAPEVVERSGDSGVSYQIEVEAFWDHPKNPGGELRVLASIDDGGFFSALVPVNADFVVTPEGELKD